MYKPNSVFLFLLFSLFHFVVVFFVTFASGVTSKIYYKIPAYILGLPLSILPEPQGTPETLSWVFIVIQSFLWGSLMLYLFNKLKKRLNFK